MIKVPWQVWTGGAGLALVATLNGVLWLEHVGSAKQAKKDAPVIQVAQTQAAVGQATGALATQALTDNSQRQSHEANIRSAGQYHILAVPQVARDLDPGVERAWRDGVDGVRQQGASAADYPPGLPGGPGTADGGRAPSPPRGSLGNLSGDLLDPAGDDDLPRGNPA